MFSHYIIHLKLIHYCMSTQFDKTFKKIICPLESMWNKQRGGDEELQLKQDGGCTWGAVLKELRTWGSSGCASGSRVRIQQGQTCKLNLLICMEINRVSDGLEVISLRREVGWGCSQWITAVVEWKLVATSWEEAYQMGHGG